MSEKRPDSFIPSLKNMSKEELKKWLAERGPFRGQSERKAEPTHGWATKGQYGYEVEIKNQFGTAVFEFASKRLIKNEGKLKIVSFGGGKLFSLVELYGKLAENFGGREPSVRIEIVDYSLKTELAKKADQDDDIDLVERRRQLIEKGVLCVLPGLLQVRDISAAADADIMLSRQGPFFHSDSPQETRQMIKKVADKLSVGGKCYFDTSLPESEDDAYSRSGAPLKITQRLLGADFEVVLRPKIDWQTRDWLEITRLKVTT